MISWKERRRREQQRKEAGHPPLSPLPAGSRISVSGGGGVIGVGGAIGAFPPTKPSPTHFTTDLATGSPICEDPPVDDYNYTYDLSDVTCPHCLETITLKLLKEEKEPAHPTLTTDEIQDVLEEFEDPELVAEVLHQTFAQRAAPAALGRYHFDFIDVDKLAEALWQATIERTRLRDAAEAGVPPPVTPINPLRVMSEEVKERYTGVARRVATSLLDPVTTPLRYLDDDP